MFLVMSPSMRNVYDHACSQEMRLFCHDHVSQCPLRYLYCSNRLHGENRSVGGLSPSCGKVTLLVELSEECTLCLNCRYRAIVEISRSFGASAFRMLKIEQQHR